MSLAQDAEGVQSLFAADQHIAGVAIIIRALGHGDGLFEADGADVVHVLLKYLHVAVARVQDLNRVDGDECDVY